MLAKILIKALLASLGIGLLISSGCVMKVYDRPYPVILEPTYSPPQQTYYKKTEVESYNDGSHIKSNKYTTAPASTSEDRGDVK